MKPHKEKLSYEINPTCTKKGKKVYICEFCFKKSEEEVDMIPHNYKYSILNNATGQSKGICQDCKKEINCTAPTSNFRFFDNNFLPNNNNNNFSSNNNYINQHTTIRVYYNGVLVNMNEN